MNDDAPMSILPLYYGYYNYYNQSFCQYPQMSYISSQYMDAQRNILQSRIGQLQYQNIYDATTCCCNQAASWPVFGTSMCNAYVHPVDTVGTKPIVKTAYELDKIAFPVNPIREYTVAAIKAIEDKYARRIKPLDELISKMPRIEIEYVGTKTRENKKASLWMVLLSLLRRVMRLVERNAK